MRAGCALAAATILAGCLASPPASVGGEDPIDAGVDPDAAPPLPPIPIELIGDLVTLDCNESNEDAQIAFDRSGGSRHGSQFGTGRRTDGPFGSAREMGPSGGVFIARDAAFEPGPDGFTIEAFVWLETGGQTASIASDYLAASDPPVTFDLLVENENYLAMVTDDDGIENVMYSTELTDPIPLQTWTHLAVSWDRTTVAFFVDGDLVSALPFAAAPRTVSDKRFVHFGGRSSGSFVLDGALDEIKISSYAKSADQIAASMAFDSRDLLGRCGDRLLEGSEACDGQGLCCSDSCQSVDEDAVCSAAGGTCSAGACKLPDRPRASDGLVALYTFADVTGGVVRDEAGAGPPADLEIASGSAVQDEGFLRLSNMALLRADTADKVAEQCTASNEITVEAWVAAADSDQDGPARIVTHSDGPDQRNFMLAHAGRMWVARVLSDGSDYNGNPLIASADGDVRAGVLTHLVLTVAGGQRRLYVDGRLRSIGFVPGDFTGAGWNPDFALLVGNEEGGARPWSGAIHLLAIYDRALSELEVAENFAAGANPEL